ncbi:MAG: ROK family protein [Acidimicrobiia bacterium]
MDRTQITAGRDAHHRARGVAAEELRRHNLATVLERLHLLGPISRSELTATMGLNRSTIADLIGELTTLGLVEEGPAVAASGPGRPSPMVRTMPQGASVLAIELSVDSVAVATVGLGGHVYQQLRVARPRGRFSPQETVEDVVRLAGPLLESLPSDSVLAGVGAGVAGVTRRSDGFVHIAPNLGWRNVPLGAMLAAELGLSDPVLVANEADLGALAEFRRGVGAGVPHLIYISGEAGIGAGIIHDGKPMLGAAGYAGEAGHTLINPNGQRCRCGATGCWETEAGEAALARHAGIPPTVAGLGVLDAVMARANAGDQRTLEAIAQVGHWLGLGIGNLINVFNPQVVVLGGFYHPLFPFLEKAVLEGARRGALDAPGDIAGITSSGLGSDAPLIGAAEMALSEVIADPARTAGRSVRLRPPVEGESGG